MVKAVPQSGTGSTGTSNPDSDDFKAQIATLRADVETLTAMVRDSAEHKFSSARAQAAETAEHARSEMEARARQMADAASQYQTEVETAVKNHPTAALGIATGIGFLAGLWLSRR